MKKVISKNLKKLLPFYIVLILFLAIIIFITVINPLNSIELSHHFEGFQSSVRTVKIYKITKTVDYRIEHDDDEWKKFDSEKSFALTDDEYSKLMEAYEKTNGNPDVNWHGAIVWMARGDDQCSADGKTCREKGNQILDNYLKSL